MVLSTCLLSEAFLAVLKSLSCRKLRVSSLCTAVGELPISGKDWVCQALEMQIEQSHETHSEEALACRIMEAELKAWLIKEWKGNIWEFRTWVKQKELVIWCHLVISSWGPLASNSECHYILCWPPPPPPLLLWNEFQIRGVSIMLGATRDFLLSHMAVLGGGLRYCA